MPRKSKEGTREYHLIKTYGLNETTYQKLVTTQHGLCAICLQPPKINKRLYVDHCHKTNKIRGLLCATCNTFIGKLKEDPILLSRSRSYLARFVPEKFTGVVRHVDLL